LHLLPEQAATEEQVCCHLSTDLIYTLVEEAVVLAAPTPIMVFVEATVV
jgi:hypothetical protein